MRVSEERDLLERHQRATDSLNTHQNHTAIANCGNRFSPAAFSWPAKLLLFYYYILCAGRRRRRLGASEPRWVLREMRGVYIWGRVCAQPRFIRAPIFANFFVRLFSGRIIYANEPLGFKQLLAKGGNKITLCIWCETILNFWI